MQCSKMVWQSHIENVLEDLVKFTERVNTNPHGGGRRGQTVRNDVNKVSRANLSVSLIRLSFQVRNHPKRSCQFNRTVLDECSGLQDRSYGYQSGQPCVLIKLNRVKPLNTNPLNPNPNPNFCDVLLTKFVVTCLSACLSIGCLGDWNVTRERGPVSLRYLCFKGGPIHIF